MTRDDYDKLSFHEKEAIRHNRGVSVVILADGTYAIFAHGRPNDSVVFVRDPNDLAGAIHRVYTWMLQKMSEPGDLVSPRVPVPAPSKGTVVEISL